MLVGSQLNAALATLPVFPMSGIAYRVIQVRYLNTALSSIGSRLGGRYNTASVFEALYIGDHPVTCLLETEALTKIRTEIRCWLNSPQLLLSLQYRLNAVIDLRDVNHQTILNTNLQELTGNWRLMNALGQPAPTQVLGEAIYNLQSIEALKVPSAREPNSYNLVVFPDRLSANSFLRVYDDTGTINAQLP